MRHRPGCQSGARTCLAPLLVAVMLARAAAARAGEAGSGAGSDRRPGDGSIVQQETPAERERRRRLTERPDEERPTEQIGIPIFGRLLSMGGEIETRVDFEGNPRLGTRDDDRARLIPLVELELFYPASEGVSLFAEGKYEFDWSFYQEEGGTSQEHRLRRGESWLLVEDVWDSGFGFDVGRLDFRDSRRWWWDENLDAVRVFFDDSGVRIDAAVAYELAPEDLRDLRIDPEREDVLRIIAGASWRYTRRHRVEFFALHHADRSVTEPVGSIVREEREDESDAELTWLGAGARGRFELGERGTQGTLHYWVGGATLRGEEGRLEFDEAQPGTRVVESVATRDVVGFATDLLLTWETLLPGLPFLSAGYGFGSGDGNPQGEAFRQTGLQRNDARILGVGPVRYYGELLDPELSNLHVTTAALGLPLGRWSSAELLHHYYHQAQASELMRARGIRIDPEGEAPSIGNELDLVLGFEGRENRRIELVGSLFRAGAAYGAQEGELAFGIGGKFEVVF